jgi:hypothetical protein
MTYLKFKLVLFLPQKVQKGFYFGTILIKLSGSDGY